MDVNLLYKRATVFYKLSGGILTDFHVDLAKQSIGFARGQILDLSNVYQNFISNRAKSRVIFAFSEIFLSLKNTLHNIGETFRQIKKFSKIAEQLLAYEKKITYDMEYIYSLPEHEADLRIMNISKLAKDLYAKVIGPINLKTLVQNLYDEEPDPEKSVENFRIAISSIFRYVEQMFDLMGVDIDLSTVDSEFQKLCEDYYAEYPPSMEEAMDDLMEPEHREEPEMVDAFMVGRYF